MGKWILRVWVEGVDKTQVFFPEINDADIPITIEYLIKIPKLTQVHIERIPS